MRAAIYTRRSTDEHQAESLEVQKGEALRFVEAKGWHHDPKHLYVDDAISRAEFVKRPAFIAMTNAAEAGEFDVVVVRDETRLGGDMLRTTLWIQTLLDHGVRLFYYYGRQEVVVEGAHDRFVMMARNFAAELEREKTSQRVHENHLTKARRGLVAGGVIYGYDNVRRPEGGVVRAINEEQAAVVVMIFEMRARGDGYRTIAQALNERGIAPPSAKKRGTGSWSPGCLAAILSNEHYCGEIIWNRWRKLYKGGTKKRELRPESEWIRLEVPEYRIVSDELWQQVRARDQKNAKVGGRRGKRPGYLLTGLARCAECGGPMHVTNGKSGKRAINVSARVG